MSNNEYDSVLLEKEKYEEVIDDRPFIRRHLLGIDFLVIVLILLGGFIYYFNVILNPNRIILDDVTDGVNFVDKLFSFIRFDGDDSYSISGNIKFVVDSNVEGGYDKLDRLKMNYSFDYDKGNSFLTLDSDRYKFDYYHVNDLSVLNYDEKYVNIEDKVFGINDYIYTFDKIKSEVFKYFYEIDFNRDVIFSDDRLLVEVSGVISGKDINRIYRKVFENINNDKRCSYVLSYLDLVNKNIVSDEAEFIVTVRNDLFLNDLVYLKIILNDSNYRGVLTYSSSLISYSDGVNNYKLEVDNSSDLVSFSFYDKDVLSKSFSVNFNSSMYNYSNYIDKKYIILIKDGSDNNYNYTLNIKKEGDEYLDFLCVLGMKYNNSVDLINTPSYYEKDLEYEGYNYMMEIYDEIISLLKSVNFL